MNTFSKKEAFGVGWRATKDNFGFFLKIVFVLGILYLALPFVIEWTFGQNSPNKSAVLNLIASLVTYFFQIVVSIGLVRVTLKIVDGQKPNLSDLVIVEHIGKYIWAGFLYGLIVIGGTILLIVPGVIWSLKYQFYPYLIVDKRLRGRESIKESGRMTKGNIGNLFLFALLAGLLNMAGFVALGIGLFATIPTTMIAMAYIYRKLQTLSTEVSNQTPLTPTPETITPPADTATTS